MELPWTAMECCSSQLVYTWDLTRSYLPHPHADLAVLLIGLHPQRLYSSRPHGRKPVSGRGTLWWETFRGEPDPPEGVKPTKCCPANNMR